MPKTFLNLPHGLEVLIIKASVDPEFNALLLEHRAAAAGEIGLTLTPAESAMLAAIPTATLESTIAQTQVLPETRRIFLGKVAAAMLAALGVGGALTGCSYQPATQGISPDLPQKIDRLARDVEEDHNKTMSGLREIRQDQDAIMDDLKNQTEVLAKRVNQQQQGLHELRQQIDSFTRTQGIRPDRPSMGILPDRPQQPESHEDRSIPPISHRPKSKTDQPAITTTEEMIDLRTLVEFPKPTFGSTPYRLDKDALRDGWDLSPDSKRP